MNEYTFQVRSLTDTAANSMRNKQQDEAMQQELALASEGLVRGDRNPKLAAALRERFPSLTHAHVIYWIPEQGEEIFLVLVDGHTMVTVEVNREPDGGMGIVEICSLAEYRRQHPRLARGERDRLHAALELFRVVKD